MRRKLHLLSRSPSISLFVLVLLTAAVCSCAPAYNPNAIHTPLYTQEGEVHAAAYLGTSGYDAYASWSPSENFAVSAAVSMYSSLDSIYTSQRSLGEIALGYYTSKEKVGRIDLIAGIGTGRARSSILAEKQAQAFGKGWLKEFSGSFNRYFVQGIVGLPVESFISSKMAQEAETGIAVRAAYVHFYEVDTVDRPARYLDNLFFEPVFFARSGWENVKIELQAGVSFPLTQRIAYDWQLFHCAVGFHLTFGKKYENDKPTPPPDGVPNPVPPYVEALPEEEEGAER